MTSPAAAALLGLLSLAPQDPSAPDEARFLSEVRQLSFEGRRAGESYFHREGQLLVFQSEREPGNPWYQIYLLDLESGETERISPGVGKTTCAWVHPDGRHVLYASTHADPRSKALQDEENAFRASGQQRRYAWDYDEHFELYAYDREKKETRRLTDARGYDAEGSYSPDGQWIAWSSNRAAYAAALPPAEQERLAKDPAYFLDLYLMRADGTELRRLTDVPGYDGGPFFSPDGKQLCFRRFAPDGATAEIYTLELESGRERKLTALNAMSWAPFFHPSQEYLIFTTNRHGFANFELYLVDAQGRGEPVRVSSTPGFDGLPCFTPDGTGLAWTSNRTADQTSQIFVARWNHAAAQQALRATFPSERADDRRLVDESERLRFLELAPLDETRGMLLRASDGAPALAAVGRLSAGAAHRSHPVWIGARLAKDAQQTALSHDLLLRAVEVLRAQRASGKLALDFDVVFALWSAGAEAVDPRALIGPGGIAAYIDLTALEDWSGAEVALLGLGTSTGWKSVVEKANSPVGLALRAQDAPPTSGFAAPFAAAEIPTLALGASGSARAASASPDDAARARLARFAALLARAAARGAQPLKFTRYERPQAPAGGGRPWLGTIPDYAPAGIPGLKLSGVAPGGPAAKAGLQAGDIVVAMGGREVKGIDDFAACLDALKIGEPVAITVVRGGAKLDVTATPTKRDG
ncbi:MAG: PD40 domain-containing protein [Planctomycetes bacterium]|nr:PD40 domain-containing protein [Planctomycetota bacterium]